MKNHDQKCWHHLPASEALQVLDMIFATGSSADEAKLRHAEHGLTRMTAHRGTPTWVRFLQQLNQSLVYILLTATGVSAMLGEWVEAAGSFGVVLSNAIVGFVQVAKAKKPIEALTKMVRTEATVGRDGRKQRISSTELVPGDVVLLQSCDSVPADVRFVEVRSLQVEEAGWTAESASARWCS